MIVQKNSVKNSYEQIYTFMAQFLRFPIWQRGYAWKIVQMQGILDDILTLANMTHAERAAHQFYCMDIVQYIDSNGVYIADGQQRCVSLAILMRCINEYIVANSLSLPLLNVPNMEYEDETMQRKYHNFAAKPTTTAPFAAMYKQLQKWVADNASQLSAICDVLCNDIYVIVKTAATMDDAYQIFVEINSGGKPLSKDDVIKALLKQAAKKYVQPIDDFNFKDMKNLITSYYKLRNTSASSSLDNFAMMSFMSQYVIKDAIQFKAFCAYVRAVDKVNEHPFYHIISYIQKGQLLNVLYALTIKGIDVNTNRAYLDDCLMPLALLSLVWKVRGQNPGGIAKAIFQTIFNMIEDGKKPAELRSTIIQFITENEDVCKIPLTELSDRINHLNVNSKKAILLMDTIVHNTSGRVNVATVHLEHVYPQKPCDAYALNGWPGSTEQQAELIDDIGNMILLCDKVNTKIQNKYITEKRPTVEDIRDKDLVLQTTLNQFDFDAFERDKGAYIKQRHHEICVGIQQNFPFGKLIIT